MCAASVGGGVAVVVMMELSRSELIARPAVAAGCRCGAGCRQDADISAEFAASKTLCPARQ